ncbi:tail fiber domain-containing protein [Siphonobacter sp.]|uniref:tail fiber domain-containing protein n=1 Tax=Siphonobacter sp. TaxID=1869184 RepID=UPI003B3A8C81
MTPKQLLSTGCFSVALMTSATLFAQVKVGSNPTTIGTNTYLEVEADNAFKTTIKKDNGFVGIGTATPLTHLHVWNGNLSVNHVTPNTFATGIEAAGSFGVSNTNGGNHSITVGNGNSLGAPNSLVVGYQNTADGTASQSFVYGTNNQAKSGNTLAGGFECLASGTNSIALGQNTKSTGGGAIALGYNNEASGANALAFGHTTRATGASGIALGYNTLASGDNSMAFGHSTQATGGISLAMGFSSTASGDNSVAIGRQAKAIHEGSMVLTDGYSADFNSAGVNTMHMRFIGGYWLRTNTNNVGVRLQTGETSWSAVSDIRSKKDISALEGGLATVMQLQPKKYHYKGNKNTHYSLGFIAQEVQKVLPDVVDVPQDKNEYMSIRYTEVIPVLTKAIQEQQAQIEALKAENKALKAQTAKVEALSAKLEAMEAKIVGSTERLNHSQLSK